MTSASARQSGEFLQFEHTVTWDEQTYARLRQVTPPSRRARLRMLLVAVLGVMLLFWPYSAPVGVILLLIAGFFWFTPRISRWGTRNELNSASYLAGPVSYGVTEAGVWMHGGPLRAESAWSGLRVWDLRHGWLMLAASGMPPVYLPEAELRAAGLFEQVLARAKDHAVEFDAVEREKHRARAV